MTTRRHQPGRFRRERLPAPAEYFRSIGLQLSGRGAWRDALCPFHADHRPSLGVMLESGGFCCRACGAKGGNVLDFHMMLNEMGFKDAARDLGAWEETE